MSTAIDNRFNLHKDADFVLKMPMEGGPPAHPAFMVHKERLRNIPFYRDMLACTSEGHHSEETFEGLPVLSVDETKDVYLVVLGFLYDREEEADIAPKNYNHLLEIWELANKLGMVMLTVALETRIKSFLIDQQPQAALHLHVRAGVHGRAALAKAAYPRSHAGRFSDLKTEDLVALSKTELVALANKHFEAIRAYDERMFGLLQTLRKVHDQTLEALQAASDLVIREFYKRPVTMH